MYSEELEKLIEMALIDGDLTEKEKQILFKRAEKYGVDLDEFEMVLDARLFERTRSLNQEKYESSAPKSNKFGNIKKCPSCGSIVESFTVKCPDCGYEFSGVAANNSIEKLFKLLNDAESERTEKSAMQSFISEAFDLGGLDKVGKKKKEIISNFPIPTTREDMLEFLSLALPKAKKIGNFFTQNQPENKVHNNFVPVWRAKCEQIIMKAKFSMKDDKEALNQIINYGNEIGIN